MSGSHACDQFRDEIGALIDDESPPRAQRRTERHLRECGGCSRYRDELIGLRRGIAEMPLEEPRSVRLWERIDHELGSGRSRRRRLGLSVGSPRPWAVAATMLLALALGYGYAHLGPFWDEPSAEPIPPPIALTVGDYVHETTNGSADAFWSRYSALETDPDTAAQSLNFQPWMPRELPGGYRLATAKLLKDACCYTLQLRYESDDGALDVFQCHDDHPVTYGRARTRREQHAGITYTSLDWEDSPLKGRAFSGEDLTVVLVGDIDSGSADRIVEEMHRQVQRPAAFDPRPLPAEHTGTALDGCRFRAADLRGKVGLLDFWAGGSTGGSAASGDG